MHGAYGDAPAFSCKACRADCKYIKSACDASALPLIAFAGALVCRSWNNNCDTPVQVEGNVDDHDVIVSSTACPSKGCKANLDDPACLQRAVAIAMTHSRSVDGSASVEALVLLGVNASHALKTKGRAALEFCLQSLSQRWKQAEGRLKVSASC